MQFTQSALILLAIFWSLQVAGSWMQWSHYRRALTSATGAWGDGFLGMGQHRPKFGLGAIALLEVGPDLRVRRLQMMSGVSVFARFKPQDLVVGWPLSKLATEYAPGVRDDRSARAIRQAIVQVEEVRAKQQQR
jgi:DNA-binding transcriptional regulator of glucitol operon